MFLNPFHKLTAVAVVMSVAPQIAAADCSTVSGTIAATVIGGEPLNVLGTVYGDLAGATRAVVLGQSANDDGTVGLKLAHDFATHDRGTLKTEDSSVWTPVPGHAGLFHMATDYTIVGGSGQFAGASGHLMNDGIADTNTGLVTLRYDGEVCTK